MPPLPIPKVRHGTVSNTPLVPHHHRPLLPTDAAAEVEAPDMAVQKRQQRVRLLGQESFDPARDGGVHEEARLAGYRVPDDERVRCGDGFPEGALRAHACDFSHGR